MLVKVFITTRPPNVRSTKTLILKSRRATVKREGAGWEQESKGGRALRGACFLAWLLRPLCAAAFAAIVIVQISINTKSRKTGCDQQMKKYMIIIEKLWILDPSVLDSLVLVEITGVGKWRRDRLRETDDHLPCRQITSTNRNNDYFCTICIWEPALIGLLISLQWVRWEICHDYWSGCTREAPTQRKERAL